MLKGLLSGLNSRTAILSVILVSNAFVWYYVADDILLATSRIVAVSYWANLQVWIADFAGLIASALVGAYFTKRLGDKTRFLSVWMLIGIALPFTSLAIQPTDTLSITLLSLVFGCSLGIGLPSCMGYFTKHTGIDQRGRLGGMIILFTGVSAAVIGALGSEDLLTQAIFLAVWRGFGLLSFILLKPREQKLSPENTVGSYKSIIRQRTFILYFLPWVVFSLVNYSTTPVIDQIFSDPNQLAIVNAFGNILIAASAVVAGFLIDTIGRKRIAIAGFVTLGLGYAVLGLSPTSQFSWYFHTAVDGVAWGFLIVVFVTTIWGDLSHEAASDKYYAVGVMPFFISRFLPLALSSQIEATIPENTYAVFSFTAFFLFLAVLPLVYVPETLPEKVMKERELKTYLEKAQEIVAKAHGKNDDGQENAQEESADSVKLEVPQKCDEEAEALAQEYY